MTPVLESKDLLNGSMKKSANCTRLTVEFVAFGTATAHIAEHSRPTVERNSRAGPMSRKRQSYARENPQQNSVKARLGNRFAKHLIHSLYIVNGLAAVNGEHF